MSQMIAIAITDENKIRQILSILGQGLGQGQGAILGNMNNLLEPNNPINMAEVNLNQFERIQAVMNA